MADVNIDSRMLKKRNACKNNFLKPFAFWFWHFLFLLIAMPVDTVPNPYHHTFKIYLITRPADLAGFGESYEVNMEAEQARLVSSGDIVDTPFDETVRLERQESTGFEVASGQQNLLGISEVVDPNTGEIQSIRIIAPSAHSGNR